MRTVGGCQGIFCCPARKFNLKFNLKIQLEKFSWAAGNIEEKGDKLAPKPKLPPIRRSCRRAYQPPSLPSFEQDLAASRAKKSPPGLDLAMNLYGSMCAKDSFAKPDAVTYSILIQAAGECGSVGVAASLAHGAPRLAKIHTNLPTLALLQERNYVVLTDLQRPPRICDRFAHWQEIQPRARIGLFFAQGLERYMDSGLDSI